jgi:protein-tyrosine phosphatase
MKVFWVTKRLAFGSAITTGQHVEQLEALGITHVVNLRHGNHTKQVRQFKSLWLPFPDDKEPRPKWFYRHALRFYVKAMRKPDAKVFVMCHHGICRSASLTYFFLRLSQEGSTQAEALVRKARPTARVVPAYRESCEAFLLRARR